MEPLEPRLAVIVLGCRPGSQALARRVRAGRDTVVTRRPGIVIACGGRSWSGRVEADEIARMLEDGGVPASAILRERASNDTHENARFAAPILLEHGVKDVVVVTCSWHLRRATMLFQRMGLVVEGVGVEPPDAGVFSRVYWSARERVASWKDLRRPIDLERNA